MANEYPIYRAIGRNVKKARIAKGWTQKQLARKINVSRETISDIECGRGPIYVHRLLDLAGALNMGVERKVELTIRRKEKSSTDGGFRDAAPTRIRFRMDNEAPQGAAV